MGKRLEFLLCKTDDDYMVSKAPKILKHDLPLNLFEDNFFFFFFFSFVFLFPIPFLLYAHLIALLINFGEYF